MELTFAAATDVGRQRQHNEDNFLIDKKLRLFLVADGMGGHAAGEVASSIAVHEIRDAVYGNRDLIDRYRADGAGVQALEILQMLEHAVQAACSTVYNRAQTDSEKRGMGTTASVLLIAGAPDHLRGFIAHVGDSRIYLYRDQRLQRLTRDHTVVQQEVDAGRLTPKLARIVPHKNILTQSVGYHGSVEPDTSTRPIRPGDIFVICSDGLTDPLDDERIAQLCAQGPVDELAELLTSSALSAGADDNITVVVVAVSDE